MATTGTITQITYPQVFTMEGDETYIGYKAYRDDNGNPITSFVGAYHKDFHFQPHPQTDPYTRPLIIDLAHYSNGIDLRLEYFTVDRTDQSPPYCRIEGKTILVDHRTGEEIDIDSPISAESNFYKIINLSTGSMDQLNYIPCRYYPSFTEYTTTSGETYVGDPASNLIMFGDIIWSETPGLYPITGLSGELDRSEMLHYKIGSIGNGLIYSGEAYDRAVDALVGAGDGTNPVTDPSTPSDKPFENHHSTPGGGYGGYTGKGDETGKPTLPSSAVLSSGFIAMYNPTTSQLQQLGNKLWSNDFVNSFLKLWNDPMEAIISLALVPFTPTSSGSTNCKIGNYDSEVSMSRVTAQYQTFSCGSVAISEYWGSALDYGPYTQAEIFLPFVGMRELDIDDIMNKTVSIDYNVDLLGGEAVCYVTVNNRVLYDYRCNLQTNVPISSSSFANLYSGILSGAKGVALGAAFGGGVGAAAGALTSAVNVVTSKHSTVERGGELSPNAGTLGLLTPYIILHRPIQSLPSNFGHFKGYPSNMTRTLSNVTGYTEVEYIHLDGISATDSEKEEILSLLKAGVIL